MRKTVIALAVTTFVAPALADSPLPKDLLITPPDVSIPKETSRFSGIWKGEWGGGALDGALAVTRVLSADEIEVIYSWRLANNQNTGFTDPFVAKVSGDELILPKFRNGAEVTYRLDGKELRGFYTINGKTTEGLFYK